MRALIAIIFVFSFAAMADISDIRGEAFGTYEQDLDVEKLQEPQAAEEFAKHLGLMEEVSEGEREGQFYYARQPYSRRPYPRRGYRRPYRPGYRPPYRPGRPYPPVHGPFPGPFYRPVPSYNGVTCFATDSYTVYWGQSFDGGVAQNIALSVCASYGGGYYCRPLGCQLNYY